MRVEARPMPTSLTDSLLQYVADALIGIDRTGKVVIWAGSAEAMFGYSRDEAMGCDFAQLVVAGSAEDHVQSLREVLASRATTSRELVRRCKDGSLIYVDATFAPVPWEKTG